MTDAPVFSTPAGASGNTIGPADVQLDLLGMTVMAMATGRIEMELTEIKPMLVDVPQAG